jgi:hypothetical protein
MGSECGALVKSGVISSGGSLTDRAVSGGAVIAGARACELCC